ncbi:MAG: protoporphyrinogen oxidase HemJ [Alphaproteobacteria bacterium]
MMDILAEYYLLIKALHVIAVIAWMAGLLYLPRLYVYHADVEPGSERDKMLQVMEHRLLRYIMNPAMIVVWVLGLILMSIVDAHLAVWFHIKFALVFAMSGMHGAMSKWRKNFAKGENTKPARFYRIMNEVPTVLMIGIVLLVYLKPFG